MTNKQSNKIKMLRVVQSFFQQEEAKLSTFVPLSKRRNTLTAHLEKVEKDAQEQATNTTAHTEVKYNSFTELRDYMIEHANVASDYFADKDSPLQKQLSISKSQLDKMTGVQFETLCTKLYGIINDHIADLNPDFVSTEEATELLAKINKFDAKVYDAELAKDTTQNATDFLKIGLQNCMKELRLIDRLMKKFATNDKELYSRYKLARKIIDLGGGGNTPPPSNT